MPKKHYTSVDKQNALKEHCNALKYGQCTVLACMVNNGYIPGKGSPKSQNVQGGTCVFVAISESLC